MDVIKQDMTCNLLIKLRIKGYSLSCYLWRKRSIVVVGIFILFLKYIYDNDYKSPVVVQHLSLSVF